MESSEDKLESLKSLSERFERLKSTQEPFRVTDELLARFLTETTDVHLSPRQRLIAFASNLSDYGDWGEACKAYEYILASYPENASGIYAAWLASSFPMITETELSLDARRSVAADMELILERARQINESGFAQASGLFYLLHPCGDESEGHYLHRAVHWLELSVKQKIEDDELDSVTVCYLAHAYFELGKIEEAMSWYKKVDLDCLEPDGRFSRQAVLERLNECKRFLDPIS